MKCRLTGYDLKLETPSKEIVREAGKTCFVLGFASITASIATWALVQGRDTESRAHAERFGIFVGLWAPTFFILSSLLDNHADKMAEAEQIAAATGSNGNAGDSADTQAREAVS